MPKITDNNDVKTQAYRGGEEALVLTPDNKLARVPFETLRNDTINYQTKAAMDAAGAPANGQMAKVWNDPTEENNGEYGWDGAAWLKSEYQQISSKNVHQYISKSKSGRFSAHQVTGNYAITGDWSTKNTALSWSINSNQELEISDSTVFSTPQFFDVGIEYYGGDAAFEIESQVNTNLTTNQNGCYVVIGSDSNNYMEFLYANNGAIYIYDRAANVSSAVEYSDVAFAMGETAKMRVEITAGVATIIAIAPDGTRRSHSQGVWTVPVGRVLPGWRKSGTGIIRRFSFAEDESESGVNEVENPNGEKGVEGWLVQSEGAEIIAIPSGGFRYSRQSGSEELCSYDVQIPDGVDKFSYGLEVTSASEPSDCRILLLQYSDAGPGIVDSNAEIMRIDVPASKPKDAGYIFRGVADISPTATRIVIVVGLSGYSEVEFRNVFINFKGQTALYVEPKKANDGELKETAGRVSGIDSRLLIVESQVAMGNASLTERKIPISTPEGFTFDDHGINIYRGLVSKSVYTDFNPETKRIQASLEIYVDPDAGDDSAPGTEIDPLRTLVAAIDKMNTAAESATIILNAGQYYSGDIGDLSSLNILENFNIVCENGTAELIQGDVFSGWIQDSTYTNLWYADIVGAPALWGYDRKNRDEYGEEIPIRPRNQSDANSIPNSCFVDGQRVYVHLYDGREPDSDVVILRDLPSLYLRDRLFYLKNIEFHGGSHGSGGVYTAHAAGDSCTNNCRFSYAYSGNAFAALRGRDGRIFHFRTTASYSRTLDGFNYHKGSQSLASDIVEIECNGHHNGLMMSANNNGTTMHDGGRSIRINSTYTHNMNRNVHDINDGTECWLLGVDAGSAQTTDTDEYNSANYILGRRGANDETKAWLDSCTSSGDSVSDYSVYESTEMRVKNTDIGRSGLSNNVILGTLGKY